MKDERNIRSSGNSSFNSTYTGAKLMELKASGEPKGIKVSHQKKIHLDSLLNLKVK